MNSKDIKNLLIIILLILLTVLMIYVIYKQSSNIISQYILPETQKEFAGSNKFIVYLFWGYGCSHCSQAELFLENLKGNYPGMEIRKYEVFNNNDNYVFLSRMLSAYNVRFSGTPVIFIGDRGFSGFTKSMKDDIEQAVKRTAALDYSDPVEKLSPQDRQNLPIGQLDH